MSVVAVRELPKIWGRKRREKRRRRTRLRHESNVMLMVGMHNKSSLCKFQQFRFGFVETCDAADMLMEVKRVKGNIVFIRGNERVDSVLLRWKVIEGQYQ